MKISGDKHLVVTYTWSKYNYCSKTINGRKIDCPKIPLYQNTPLPPTTNCLGLKPLKVEPLLPELRLSVVHDVTSFKYTMDIPKCKSESKVNCTLFIGILSAASYF